VPASTLPLTGEDLSQFAAANCLAAPRGGPGSRLLSGVEAGGAGAPLPLLPSAERICRSSRSELPSCPENGGWPLGSPGSRLLSGVKRGRAPMPVPSLLLAGEKLSEFAKRTPKLSGESRAPLESRSLKRTPSPASGWLASGERTSGSGRPRLRLLSGVQMVLQNGISA